MLDDGIHLIVHSFSLSLFLSLPFLVSFLLLLVKSFRPLCRVTVFNASAVAKRIRSIVNNFVAAHFCNA
jgi:hypothetical protein